MHYSIVLKYIVFKIPFHPYILRIVIASDNYAINNVYVFGESVLCPYSILNILLSF